MKNLITFILIVFGLSAYSQNWESVIPNSVQFENSIGSQLGGWHDQGSLTIFKDQLYVSGNFENENETGTLIFDGRYTSILPTSTNPISNYAGQTVHLTSTDSLLLSSNLSPSQERLSESALENTATLAFDSKQWYVRFTNRKVNGQYYYRVQNTLQIEETTFTLARKDTLLNNEEVAIWDILALSPTDTQILPVKALVNSPFGLFNIDGQLFINQLQRPDLPNYQYVNGKSLPRLAKWEDGNWEQVGLTEVSNTAQSVINHDGVLVAAGDPYDNSGLSSVQQLANNNWVNIGSAAFAEGVTSIVSYRDVLFALIGGSEIYRYNGLSWTKVNDQKLLDYNGNPGGGKQIIGYKDDLYVAGNFASIDSLPIAGLAKLPIILTRNKAPRANGESVEINDGEDIEIHALLNDTDDNEDYLRINVLTQPTLGSATITSEEAIFYSAFPFKTGDDIIEYEVCDRSGGCDTTEVRITIHEKNAAPIATDEHFLKDDKGYFKFNPIQNDYDPENEGLRLSIISDPQFGDVEDFGNFNMVYFPNITKPYQADKITYAVCDSFNACDTAEATFTTRLKYLEPVANNDYYSPADQKPNAYNLSVNDQIREYYPLTYSIESKPIHGNLLEFHSDSFIVVYSPGDPAATYDYFTYMVCDSVGNCSSAMVEFQLIPEKTTGLNINSWTDVSVYPNPANSVTKIHSPDIKFDQILITDQIGRFVFRLDDEGQNEKEIHPNLPPGIYHLMIMSNGKVIGREKLIWID